jgi:hypothetical protein
VSEPYQRPVARIWSKVNVVGAGVLAPRGVVITCAHVVNAALGRSERAQDRPDEKIRVDLPWAGQVRYAATVVDWRPPPQQDQSGGDPCVDIAVCRLDRDPPPNFAVMPHAPAAVPEDTAFRVMGFPAKADSGAPARGFVRGTVAGGWHHVETDKSFGRAFEVGFSGAPAITEISGNRLLGIINVANPEERRAVLIPVQALMRAWPPLAEPYRGLEAFREEDAAYYFGREVFKERLWRGFEQNLITLLIGPSGSGKSSLLNAGFLPRLHREQRWKPLHFRPGDRPIYHLAREIVGALRPHADGLERTDETVKRARELLNDPSLLVTYADNYATQDLGLCIFIDQFEETFTLAQAANPEQHTALLSALGCVARQPGAPSIKALLAMRSDFQTLLQSSEMSAELIDAVYGKPTIMLRPLRPEERELVILGPLDRHRLDVRLEDGLLGRLTEDIAHNPDALPLLEFALSELWSRLKIDDRRRELTHAAYDEIEGVSGALAKHADAVLSELNVDFGRVKRLLIELVRVSEIIGQDARRPRSKEQLDAIDPALWDVARTLADKRLLVLTGEPEPAADIVHEALFRRWDRLRAWIDEERDFLRWRQRLDERLQDWIRTGADPHQLLQGNLLSEAEQWFNDRIEALNSSQKGFIEQSRQAASVEQTRRECDDLWERLELSPDMDELPSHDLQALIDLSAGSDALRLAFLSSILLVEGRARRFNRLPGIVLRAGLALDVEKADALARRLEDVLGDNENLVGERQRAAVNIGRTLLLFLPHLIGNILGLTAGAIAETIEADQLQDMQMRSGRLQTRSTARSPAPP